MVREIWVYKFLLWVASWCQWRCVPLSSSPRRSNQLSKPLCVSTLKQNTYRSVRITIGQCCVPHKNILVYKERHQTSQIISPWVKNNLNVRLQYDESTCGCTHCVDDWSEALVKSHLLTPPHTACHLFLKNSFRILPPLFLQDKQEQKLYQQSH